MENDAQTYEILCLEHQGSFLYAEKVQTVEESERFWLRPLSLSLSWGKGNTQEAEQYHFYDLRGCSDILWPQAQLRSALDMELLPVLTLLQTEKLVLEADSEANQQLHAFLRCVCLASQDVG